MNHVQQLLWKKKLARQFFLKFIFVRVFQKKDFEDF